MNRLTTNDAVMKALRAHCLQIEPESPAAESAHTEPEDSYSWFHLEPPTHTERYPTEPLTIHSQNEEQIHNEWWRSNGKADAAAAAQITKQNEKAAPYIEDPTETELFETELNEIREKHQRRRRRKAQQQEEREEQRRKRKQRKQWKEPIEIIESLDFMGFIGDLECKKGLSAEAIAIKDAQKQLADAHGDYEDTYEENLMELEFGPSCHCLRNPWQYEILPLKALWGARWGAGKHVQWESKALAPEEPVPNHHPCKCSGRGCST